MVAALSLRGASQEKSAFCTIDLRLVPNDLLDGGVIEVLPRHERKICCVNPLRENGYEKGKNFKR